MSMRKTLTRLKAIWITIFCKKMSVNAYTVEYYFSFIKAHVPSQVLVSSSTKTRIKCWWFRTDWFARRRRRIFSRTGTRKWSKQAYRRTLSERLSWRGRGWRTRRWRRICRRRWLKPNSSRSCPYSYCGQTCFCFYNVNKCCLKLDSSIKCYFKPSNME